ncbi:hypothetical protein [Trichormus variabilis]|uniref:Uncharacterized protein n=1 Tax=Trichormus variabilis SAG 1403-4b TaxID=447716 RepID=A0A433UJ01_ANAVA|nr:hypothetical protein [Trichormus variabilis]MBD2629256.1 hypothetical protein [Trichormus variabilis FACHB-164]RUS93821.1 hypothetical protein DSM107003_40570 [Trichormus variabilis SAG 1403-4b]
MNNMDLSRYILAETGRITQAITTGAAWEIWMQVELIILLRNQRIQAAREVPYPMNPNLSLDALAQDNHGKYAIELKVESATNAGVQLLQSAQQDVNKIRNYPAPHPGTRWVVAIGYSADARNALQIFANVVGNNAIYNMAQNIGVMVVTV